MDMPVIKPVIASSKSNDSGESSSEGLTPPAHEEKVKIINPEDDNVSNIPVKLTKGVIEVVATRKGFYGQQRIAEGQSFNVKSKKELGEWMRCVEPELEKERKKFFKDKKARK